ncbi:hypothetical protein JOL79_06780 [Microbispora sp. RL4-1S]|uniref:Uncharacterized protein n=1 Tax=Microbispora oryzae TaxID=2806554 RepID=A0A940WGA1_9ACTN|nr:hypothetical protein [Microbispora oryzae]MBP2703502.1 hypothetical protein [Microbispora oryzae]
MKPPERRHPITVEQARRLLGRWAAAADRQGYPDDAAAYRRMVDEVEAGFEFDVVIRWRVEADDDVPPVNLSRSCPVTVDR